MAGNPARMTQGVLCSGAVIYDTLVRPVDQSEWGTTTFVESIEWHVGGNGANTSRALATLGTPVRLLGWLGCDAQGDFLFDTLSRAGVDTRAIRRGNEPTAATVAIVNSGGHRKFLHRLGISTVAFSEPVEFTPDLTAGLCHYHLASLFILPNLRRHAPELLKRARNAGLTTSFDTNWDPQGRWLLDVAPCLPHLDYLFMNEDEMLMVTGSSDPSTAAKQMQQMGVEHVVIKLGPAGCAIYSAGGEIRCPGFPVTAVDTTGAGDCFVAGFIDALLRGASLAEAGRFANAIGALNVQKIGALGGLVARKAVDEWIHLHSLQLDRIG